MKRLILIVLIVVYSCGKGDDISEFSYSVSIETECANSDTRIKYCITEQEWESINSFIDQISPNDPCLWITIKDINGSDHGGYYRSSGKTSGNSNCQ